MGSVSLFLTRADRNHTTNRVFLSPLEEAVKQGKPIIAQEEVGHISCPELILVACDAPCS